ncbi:MAG: hypothetical protein KF744_07270 [Taibaiella sp.]|nr:hypothetical protein [Taibaiella sp.]
MKTTAFISALLFLFCLPGLAASGKLITKKKTISRQKGLRYNDTLAIRNMFGDVHLSTWGRSYAGIEIVITGKARNDSDAQKLVDNVTIVESKAVAGHRATSYRTHIAVLPAIDAGVLRLSDSLNFETKVDYYIHMPRNAAIEVKNTYGNVEVGEFAGTLKVDLAYGAFHARRLLSANVMLNNAGTIGANKVAYAERCTFSGVVKGGLRIDKAVASRLEEMNGCSIGYGRDIVMSKTSGSISIDTVSGIKGAVSYTNLTLGCVVRNADLRLKYCNKVYMNSICGSGPCRVKVSAENTSVKAHLRDEDHTSLDIRAEDTRVESHGVALKVEQMNKTGRKAKSPGSVSFDMKGGSLAFD